MRSYLRRSKKHPSAIETGVVTTNGLFFIFAIKIELRGSLWVLFNPIVSFESFTQMVAFVNPLLLPQSCLAFLALNCVTVFYVFDLPDTDLVFNWKTRP